MNRFFGFSKPPTTQGNNVAPEGLPASWYRSSALYDLERRAIFSKRWILVSHQLRFTKTGDYLRLHQAGISFFLVKNRSGDVKGFHNVCRHRAFPVIENDSGTASILACKYHGWSYGLNGNLAKAPQYQDVDGFTKEANGLFPIHVQIDKLGFIWVNLESNPTPSITWEDSFDKVDAQPRFEKFDMSAYHFDHQWQMIGDYNWKTLADNYNECYHCSTGHPGVVDVTDLSGYWVETEACHIQHFSTDRPDREGIGVHSTFYYPNASMTVSPHFFYIMRCIPISNSQTQMEYEVYRHNDATDEEFQYIDGFFKQVLKEDKDLCENAQKNLNAGIYVRGELHPQKEKGALYFQKLVRDSVASHREHEKKMGKEIWPASPMKTWSEKLQEDIAFCEKLECDVAKDDKSTLAW